MSDILTDEQVREIALAIGHKPFVGSLIATLRHVQAELEDARKESWDAWADEHNSLRKENARLQAELEQTKKWANGVAKSATAVVKENAHLREALEDVKQTLLAEKDIWNESLVNGLAETIDKALATEGEGKG